MSEHFVAIGQQAGLNQLPHNSCTLLDFQKLILGDGARYEGNTGDREYVLVLLGGRCTVEAGGLRFERIGARPNVWSGKPYAVYLACRTAFAITGVGRVEIACTSAPADQAGEPFVITPDQVTSGTWGGANFSRNFHGILVATDRKVQRLIIGETYTPSGNWSTYPPHKHEVDDLPREVFAEEMYYFKVSSPEGFGLCRHYGSDGSFDNVHVVRDETLLSAPSGYHTYVSAPGYNSYYLWVLAGNIRTQAAVNDPDVGWVQKALPIIQNMK
ncbi:MAG TPA: 5-deoxy-glucuronate isomerase [Symbiobacteriaceae bacterium]|nr:5-deoxy-glucuronate isomerase [Symbiobacteriaceae bacterium]